MVDTAGDKAAATLRGLAIVGEPPHIAVPHSHSELPVSGPSQVKDVAIPLLEEGGRAALVEYLASGARAEADWKIGTEHEKFGFRTDDLRPPTFDGERGIEAVLKGLVQFGWAPVEE